VERPGVWVGEDFDEGLSETLTGMNAQNKAVFSRMQEQTQSLQDQLAQAHSEANNEIRIMRFENVLDNVGEEFNDALGKGDMYDVTKAQYDNRVKVFNAVAKLTELDQSPRSMSVKVKEALGMVLPTNVKDAGQKAILKKMQGRTKVQKPQSAKTVRNKSQTEDEMVNDLRSGLASLGK